MSDNERAPEARGPPSGDDDYRSSVLCLMPDVPYRYALSHPRPRFFSLSPFLSLLLAVSSFITRVAKSLVKTKLLSPPVAQSLDLRCGLADYALLANIHNLISMHVNRCCVFPIRIRTHPRVMILSS